MFWTKLPSFETVSPCRSERFNGLRRSRPSPTQGVSPMADHSKMKLGRKAIKTDTRTLAFGDYPPPALPPPPAAADWTKGITSWGLMMNDTLGDCTIAGVGHAVQVWTANTSGIVTVPDPTIESDNET